jgi:hypothetical protein
MELRLISRLPLLIGRYYRPMAAIMVAWLLLPSTALAWQPGGVDAPTSTAASALHAGPETNFSAYITGYSDGDNTPPDSNDISNPVVHPKAGGTGTYRDPVTVAVGHVIRNGTDTPDYAPGTIFYLSFLRKYAVVEDTCGDGDQPQNEPCHVGYRGHPWLDLYVGGGATSKSDLMRCMNSITGIRKIVQNPAPNHPVKPGGVTLSGCQLFDNNGDKGDYGPSK